MRNYKKWIGLSLGLVLIVIIGLSLVYNLFQELTSEITTVTNNSKDRSSNIEKHTSNINNDNKKLDPFAVLLIGISEREYLNDQGRADAIMLGVVDPQDRKLQLISMPRDSYVNIPGYGYNKINMAYPKGGSQLLKETVENWIDIEIMTYATLNFQGYIDMIELFGGVEVYVPRDMKYSASSDDTNIDLTEGEQVLDGEEALDFVRFRRSDDGRHASDYDRMERQQQVIEKLSEEALQLSNVTKIFDGMDVLENNVKIGLSQEELIFVSKKLFPFNFQSLKTTSLKGQGMQIDDSWYEEIPEDEEERIKDLIQELKGY